jgi:pyrroloquinoline-quinone synthase
MTDTVERVVGGAFQERLWDIIDARVGAIAPAYAALLDGSLPRPALAHWAGQLYVENRPFVGVLASILASCDDREAQTFIADDIWEETGRGEPGRNHLAIVGRFAAACGADPNQLDDIPASPATTLLLDHYRSLAQVPWVEALAAIGIGLEGSFLARPGVETSTTTAGLAARCLKQHYGLTDDDVEFFTLHDVTDVEHTRRALDIVVRHATTPAVREAVVARVDATGRAVATWASAVIAEAVQA